MAEADFRNHAGPGAKIALRLSVDEAKALAGLLGWTSSWDWMEKMGHERLPRAERERLIAAAQWDSRGNPGIWGPLDEAVRSADGRGAWPWG